MIEEPEGSRRVIGEWRESRYFVPVLIIGNADIGAPLIGGASKAPQGFSVGAFVAQRATDFLPNDCYTRCPQAMAWSGREVMAFSCGPEKGALIAAADVLERLGSEDSEAKLLLDAMSARVGRVLEDIGLHTSDAIVTTMMFNPPGAVGSSYAPDTGLRVGLHVDDHESLPARARDRATPVCCVNVGRAVRAFAYIPMTVAGLISRYSLVPIRETVRDLADTVFRVEPHAPVVQVMLPPGYGYVATAQNLIHDGLPLSDDLPDRALLMLRPVSQ